MIPPVHPHRKPHRLDQAREAAALRRHGRTYKEIAKRLGIGIRTARRYVLKGGFMSRQPAYIQGDDMKMYPSRYCVRKRI